MDEDGYAIAGAVDIDLDGVGAELERGADAGERVFWGVTLTGGVGGDDHAAS